MKHEYYKYNSYVILNYTQNKMRSFDIFKRYNDRSAISLLFFLRLIGKVKHYRNINNFYNFSNEHF